MTHIFHQNSLESEFGINITFLSNGRRKFDLDYGNETIKKKPKRNLFLGNIPQEILEKIAADLFVCEIGF